MNYIKVIIKKRLTIDKKYLNKDFYILFNQRKNIYLYPHDKVVKYILSEPQSNVGNTTSWKKRGLYHWPKFPKRYFAFLKQYKLGK
jgi:hypothetical protein